MTIPKINNVNMPEVLRHLGYRGQEITPELQSIIDETAEECISCARIAYMYELFPIDCDKDRVEILNSNLYFNSKDLAKMLFGCKMCAVLCATIGAEFDHRLNLLQATSPTKAVVFNSCGSVLVEQVVDEVEEEILKITGMKKWGHRFSPGYGDLDISAQKTMFKLLSPEKRTGISLSPSNILIPIKSVSAILGLGDTERSVQTQGCDTCDLKDYCEFRKGGNVCEHS